MGHSGLLRQGEEYDFCHDRLQLRRRQAVGVHGYGHGFEGSCDVPLGDEDLGTVETGKLDVVQVSLIFFSRRMSSRLLSWMCNGDVAFSTVGRMRQVNPGHYISLSISYRQQVAIIQDRNTLSLIFSELPYNTVKVPGTGFLRCATGINDDMV